MSDKQRKYATVKHPTIEALVHGLYRYTDRAQAIARFKNIAGNFVLTKDQPTSTVEDPALHFWIKGYAVTPEEETAGFTGHYCEMRVGTTDKGLYTLTATKLDRPITSHPQKKRLQSKHPNWGHPVMRAVKKAKLYATLEEATAELELLHTEFPEVSIPGINKLYIIVYEKREGVKHPTHKIALELVAKEGGFIITAKDNEKPATPRSKQPPAAVDGASAVAAPADKPAPPAKLGAFTAQELLRKQKRAMKRKRSDPRISKKIADNPHE